MVLNKFLSDLAWDLAKNEYLKREEVSSTDSDGRRVIRRIIEHKMETTPVEATK